MRLIDMDALMKYPIRLNHYDNENGNEDFVLGIESVLEYADNLPTVEAEPVKNGRWIEHDKKTWCTLCGKSNKDYKPPFCPHCGARMDGGDK